MSDDDRYQVHLPVFEGPLDLLLQLIEREKLDISVVSIAAVTDQFIAHIRQIEDVQPDLLADFLVLAARLVWIKSRILLPEPIPAEPDAEEDPAETLARQLREYKRFREVADALRIVEESGRHTYPRVAPAPELDARLAEGSLTLAELLAAAQRAFAEAPATLAVPPGVVVPFTLTIRDQIGLIREMTLGGRTITFRTLLTNARQRIEIIVTLLAVLELIKRDQIRVSQDHEFGEITISAAPDTEITDEDVGNGNGDRPS